MPYQQKDGTMHLLVDQYKEQVQAVLKDDSLQILQRNIRATLDLDQEKKVLLQKGSKGLGMVLSGGRDVKAPLTINKICEGLPVAQSGLIEEGDYLLSINGHSVQDKTHDEAVQMFRQAGQYITVCTAKKKLVNQNDNSDTTDDQPEWITTLEIPLSLASLTRYKPGTAEIRENTFEISCINEEITATLDFNDEELDTNMLEWWDAIYNNISLLNQREVQLQNSQMIEGEEEIICMGTVYEQLSANSQWSNWQRKFLVLRRSHIEFFSIVPKTVSEWMRPEKKYALNEISIQIKEQKRGMRSECIKLIAGIGESHIISFERHDDMVTWTNSIQCATSLTVKQLQMVSFPGTWKRERIIFVIDYNKGFTLKKKKDNVVLWCRSFSKLKKTSDNGNSMLNITFAEVGKQVREEIELNDLHIAVCTIQAFLASKVADIDMGFIVEVGLISR